MRFKLDKRTLAFVFIFLIGLSILLYPVISSVWNQRIANQLIRSYEMNLDKIPAETINQGLEAAHLYNDRLLPKDVPDSFAIRDGITDLEYENLINMDGSGLMGYILIPSINVRSPIYHYTTEEALQKGVGHLFGSSLPVGGEGTHAVLSAHRGLPHNVLFTDLDKVVVGDKFFINIYKEMFAYQIDQIEIVEPHETQGLALVPNQDYVTLVTCTPYGVNTHRILCRGHRIPYDAGDEEDIVPHRWVNMNVLVSIIGALTGILVALILSIRLRKRNVTQTNDPEEEEKTTIYI